MEALRATLLLWSAVLAWSAARAVGGAPVAEAPDLRAGPPVLVPDFARDGAQRLAWLPGFGSGRAARVVEARPRLGVPLSADTLALLPGVGAAVRRDARAALARWTRLRDGPPERAHG
jgi:hypothetical protein